MDKTKKRITQKAKEACQILADNPISDLRPGAIEERIAKGKVTYDQVYKAMAHFGYSWNEKRQFWFRRLPAWLKHIEEEEEIKWARHRKNLRDPLGIEDDPLW